MKKLKVKQLNKNTWSITDNLYATCYLIVGLDKAILIDSGWGEGELFEVIRNITHLPLIAIATHGHPDHLYGMLNIDKVYLHKNDFQLATDVLNKRKWFSLLLSLFYKLGFRWLKEFNKKTIPEIIKIEEHFDLQIQGLNIEIIHLPGHTSGSIVILDKTSRLLFSGDTIVMFPWLSLKESLPLDIFLKSIKKIEIRKSEIDLIYSGHSVDPLKTDIIKEIIHCCESIKRKEIKSKFYFHPYTRGRLYMGNKIGVLLKK